MKLIPIILCLSLASACKDSTKDNAQKKTGSVASAATVKEAAAKPVAAKTPTASPAPVATVGAWKKIPNVHGLQADVPNGVTPNGIGGAAGFHTKDDRFGFTIREIKGDALNTNFKQAQKDAKEIFFKKWVSKSETDDGWILSYTSSKLDNEANEVGTNYSFEVRRVIAGTTYKCYGAIADKEGLKNVIDSCNSIRKN